MAAVVSSPEQRLNDLLLASEEKAAVAQHLDTPTFDGLLTVDGLVDQTFVQAALNILQQHEDASGKPLNAAGLELWSPEYQKIFERIGDRLWTSLQSNEHSDRLRKALELQDSESGNPLVVVDGYAVRYVTIQDGGKADGIDDSHPTHTDDCSLTVNLCLGVEAFVGGQLEFQQGWQPDVRTAIYEHRVGTAVVHPGKIAHRALPMISGTRYHLIIWFDTEKRQQTAKKRGVQILQELVSTERSYLEGLVALTNVFGEVRKASKVVEELFGLVEKLQVFHQSMLNIFERMNEYAMKADSFEPQQHKEFVDALTGLRLLFLENVQHYAKYICSHDAVAQLCRDDKKAKKILAKIKSERQIFEHLICPVRRIPRYTLLFRDLDKYYNKRYHITQSTSHSQLSALRQVIDDLSMASTSINEQIRLQRQ